MAECTTHTCSRPLSRRRARGRSLQQPATCRWERDVLQAYDTAAATHGAYNITTREVTQLHTRQAATTSSLIVDTGASTHLDNNTGDDRFCDERRPSTSAIQTGLTASDSVDFEGVHTQYFITDDLRVLEMKRPNVLMHSQFRKALFSPAAPLRDDGTW